MNQQTYNVLYSKDGTKKRKIFHDGFLQLREGGYGVLSANGGGDLYKKKMLKSELEELQIGAEVVMGIYQVIIDTAIIDSSIAGETSAFVDTHESTPSPNKYILSAHTANTASIGPLEIDSSIRRKMRPHQIIGADFIISVLEAPLPRGRLISGCILADEMGLGKTLTALCVSYAYIRRDKTTKCLIVTPSSLVTNWCREVKKWLPLISSPLTISSSADSKEKAETFSKGNGNFLILSYEMYRKISDNLNGFENWTLMICDEGHRLKNLGTQTAGAFAACNISKRMILTGTPIQNNLDELFSVVSFAHPGFLGNSLDDFRTEYSDSILNLCPAEADVRKFSINALKDKLSKIMLQRSQADILKSLLPPKITYYVTVSMTPEQDVLYRHTVHEAKTTVVTKNILSELTRLRSLASFGVSIDSKEINSATFLLDVSGKLKLLDLMLLNIKDINDKVVIVSNFTSHLDSIEILLKSRGWASLRIDGSVPSASRQALVDRFNSNWDKTFVFLLSSRAGGVGINLIGANRLIMFDADWNPAIDAQAMSRIWREGQLKHVFIYRFFTAGTIEESILEKQIGKIELATALRDPVDSDEIKDFADIEKEYIELAEIESFDASTYLNLVLPQFRGQRSLLAESGINSAADPVLHNIVEMELLHSSSRISLIIEIVKRA